MGRPRKLIHIDASVNDAFDGVVRLLVDAQRFGFSLIELAIVGHADASASIRLTIGSESTSDCTHIANRFSRHLAIEKLTAVEQEDRPVSPAN